MEEGREHCEVNLLVNLCLTCCMDGIIVLQARRFGAAGYLAAV